MRSFAVTLAVLLTIGCFALPVQADSTPISGTLIGTNTLTATSNPDVFDTSFTGSGVDTVSGPYTTMNSGILIFTSLTTFTLSGTFEDVFASGTLFGTFSGNGVSSLGSSQSTVIDLFTGGTGAFADIVSGQVTAIGMTPAGGMFTGTYSGTIMTAPEPGSLAMLIAGIGILLVMRKRISLPQPSSLGTLE
jgi:hypothetical protein